MNNFKRILVTGGAGFIGSNYVRYSLEKHPQREIIVLDKLTYAGNMDNLADVIDKITFVKGDIAEPDDVAGPVKDVDAIVNFAAESHVDRSLLDSRPFVKTNIEGTTVLLDAACKHSTKRFVHISTDEVYGDLSGTDRKSLETDPLHPKSPYSATKAGAEQLVFSFAASFGLDVVVTRGSNTYGPFQYPEKIISLFVTNAIEDKPLPLYNDGSAVRDYMYVDDHCEGIDRVMQAGQPAQAYNIAAGVEVSGLMVAEKILQLMDKPKELITFVADRPGHDYRYAVDTTKAQSLPWKCNWTFDKGLAQTVQWYIDNPSWWTRIKENTEFRNHHDKWYNKRKES